MVVDRVEGFYRDAIVVVYRVIGFSRDTIVVVCIRFRV